MGIARLGHVCLLCFCQKVLQVLAGYLGVLSFLLFNHFDERLVRDTAFVVVVIIITITIIILSRLTGWLGTHYRAGAHLRLMAVLLFQPSKGWDCRFKPGYLVKLWFHQGLNRFYLFFLGF